MSVKLDEISAASGNGDCSKLEGYGAWGGSYINSSDVPPGYEDISLPLANAFAFYGAAGAYCAAGVAEFSIADDQIAKGNTAVAQAEQALRDDGGQVTPPPGAPTSASAPESQPAVSYPTPAPEYIGPPGCPGSAQLMAAWNAAPVSAFQAQGVGKGLSISGFIDISCWRGWVVASPIANANGTAEFSELGGLHMLSGTQLRQFNSAVCSSRIPRPPGRAR